MDKDIEAFALLAEVKGAIMCVMFIPVYSIKWPPDLVSVSVEGVPGPCQRCSSHPHLLFNPHPLRPSRNLVKQCSCKPFHGLEERHYVS